MKAQLMSVLAMLTLFPSADAAKKTERYGATPLQGDYYLYGGTLSEMAPPTRTDRKLAFMVTGPLAKQLFEQIGPDVKNSCSSAADYRERRRGDLSCVSTKVEGHACYFGLDVVTGRSTNGSIC